MKVSSWWRGREREWARGLRGTVLRQRFFLFFSLGGFHEVVSILLSFSRKQKGWDDSDDFRLGKE